MRTRWLCLEITQTVGWEARDRAEDALVDYAALVAWSEHAGDLSEVEGRALAALAATHPGRAARVLARAKELRRAMYGIFSALGSRRAAPAADLDLLNRELPDSLTHRALAAAQDGRFEWRWTSGTGARALARPLWAVTHSAAELLTSSERSRVKLCEADDCGGLFVDASRNRSRRWCDMSDCGNLAKVRRFRARRRGLG